MSIHALSTRQSALTDLLKEIQQLNQRLAVLQPPNGSNDSSAASEGASADEVRSDLSAEIHASLRQCEEELELLKQDVEDLLPYWVTAGNRRGINVARESEMDQDTMRLHTSCMKLEEDLKLCGNTESHNPGCTDVSRYEIRARVRFRKAQLLAKSNAERAAQRRHAAYLSSLQAAAAAMDTSSPIQATTTTDSSQTSPQPQQSEAAIRSQLFHRRAPRPLRDPKAAQQDLLLSATTDVTTSLRRTHALLTSELSRSRFAQETLEASNAALEELNERYGSFGEMLNRSKGLLGTLLRSQKSDTWYLETAIWVLVATIGWLLFRRLLYGPLWWFLWLPLKLLWSIGSALLGLIGVTGSGAAVEARDLKGTRTSMTVTPSVSGTVSQCSEQTMEASFVPRGADGVSQEIPRSPPGSLSETIGTMVEGTRNIAHPQATGGTSGNQGQGESEQRHNIQNQDQEAQRQDDGEEPARRADGQELRDRDEAKEPRNPKKRMHEEPVIEEPRQQGRQRDEL